MKGCIFGENFKTISSIKFSGICNVWKSEFEIESTSKIKLKSKLQWKVSLCYQEATIQSPFDDNVSGELSQSNILQTINGFAEREITKIAADGDEMQF